MNKNKMLMNLRMFDDAAGTATSIDRTGADALIPVQESREIVQGIIAQSAVLSRGRRLQNMTARQYKVPVLDMLPVAYFVNGDAGQKKTTKMQWDKKFLVAEEIAVIVPIPEAVLDDAEYDIWGEVRPRLQEAFGKVIDSAVLFGTDKPTSWRAGVVATATAAGNVVTLPASGTTDLYDVIMGENGVIAKVEEDGYFVNGHMADISMRAKLRGLRDEQGQPLFKSDMQSGTTYTLDGSGMSFPNNGAFDKTQALMISGDFSQLVYSIRQDLTYKIFTEGVVQNPDGSIAYNLMQNDMVALRAVMRLGWEIPNPINALQPTAASRCPFAILVQGTVAAGGNGNAEAGGGGN
jgi:HK97 family phage major capsid protein